MMKYSRFVWLLLCSCLFSSWGEAKEKTYIIPQKIENVRQVALSLNGKWQFRVSPQDKWSSIQVPGEAVMQGYAIRHDEPFRYKRQVKLPADYKGKRVILRFDGVYSHASLWVNGQFVRTHDGGFTRWETDITEFAKPGRNNVIELEVTDRLDDISYASGYAHHPIGGILRDVTVFAIPDMYLYDFAVETDLDSLYRDAVLKVSYERCGATAGMQIKYTLTGPDGRAVAFPQRTFPLAGANGRLQNEMPVSNPLQWDAEHPHLYTLCVSICKDQKEISRFCCPVGFREIRIQGNRMLVNGRPVKLRGACRHDIHPELGRTTTAQLDSLDVVLFKEANMNFVRTSHYPPSEKFLEYCDRYGIYVECESAVCFVSTYRQKNYAPGSSQDDPAYTAQYLSQCKEMVHAFRSHPSVLFWSIGNESVYGSNFQQSWDWVKATDKTRPVIFSYPGSVSNKQKIYDILSMHYQDVNGNVHQWGMHTEGFQGHNLPTLFDEWAHPACYTYQTLQVDPNIREFWGISLDKMWSGLFEAPGGLGGAIWGYVDETFMVPKLKAGTDFWKTFAHTAKPQHYQGDCVGYGEWGIVDTWRRRKPEFWSTQKAYSPVRLLTTQLPDPVAGEQLRLRIYNRFDHTNLNEIEIAYLYKGVRKKINAPALAPHQKGLLVVPAEAWQPGDSLEILFSTASGRLIDRERIVLGQQPVAMPAWRQAAALQVDEDGEWLRIKGNGFEIPFDKKTGLICNAVSNGRVLIEKGPFLHLDINLNHLTGAEVRKSANKFMLSEKDWQKKTFGWRKSGDQLVLDLSGTYKEVAVDIRFIVSADGRMDISYQVNGQPNGYLRETGLKFDLSSSVERLQWKRKGYWSCYPEDALSANEGACSLYESRQTAYGVRPVQAWPMDTHDYYYWADAGTNCTEKPLTRMAKGMKENIYWYTLFASNGADCLSVISPDAALACRTYKQNDGQLVLYINNNWDYPEIAWGNYCKVLEAMPCFGRMTLLF